VAHVRWGGKCIRSIKFQSFCHLPTQIYKNWWKFDKVLTKTKMFLIIRHGVNYIYSSARSVATVINLSGPNQSRFQRTD